MKIEDQYQKETAILEAICDKGCRTVGAIVKATDIGKYGVHKIIRDADLFQDLIALQDQEDYEKVREHYNWRMGYSYAEISKATGVPRHRLSWHLIRRAKKEILDTNREKKGVE